MLDEFVLGRRCRQQALDELDPDLLGGIPEYVDRVPIGLLQRLRTYLGSGWAGRGLEKYFSEIRWRLLGSGFPHLLNRQVVRKLEAHADRYVECVCGEGLPQPLHDLDGNFVGWNRYYPSPEMHLAVARALEPVCREVLA